MQSETNQPVNLLKKVVITEGDVPGEKCPVCSHDTVFRQRCHLSSCGYKVPLDIKIRYNTENTTNQYWRVLINGKEETFERVEVLCPTKTTQDVLNTKAGMQVEPYTKWHLSCVEPKIFTVSADGLSLTII